jgi:DNA ligase (NAD+)
MDRKQAAHIAKCNGADVNTSISKKTNLVIVGQNPGPTKMGKIMELNIPIISEDEFLAMIGEV